MNVFLLLFIMCCITGIIGGFIMADADKEDSKNIYKQQQL